jgi:hypothetical protein
MVQEFCMFYKNRMRDMKRGIINKGKAGGKSSDNSEVLHPFSYGLTTLYVLL